MKSKKTIRRDSKLFGKIEDVKELYREGMTIRSIGKIFDIDHSNVCRILKRLGFALRTKSNAQKLGILLGKRNVKHGSNHPSWKGGRKIKGPYIYVFCQNHPSTQHKYVAEHRLVVEKQIGRFLTKKEQVHHLGNKDDNRPHMLMAFKNRASHNIFECGKSVLSKDIIFDGRKLNTISDKY